MTNWRWMLGCGLVFGGLLAGCSDDSKAGSAEVSDGSGSGAVEDDDARTRPDTVAEDTGSDDTGVADTDFEVLDDTGTDTVADTVADTAVEDTTPNVCGDGVAAGLEPCDGTDFRGRSCTLLGFVGGEIACAPDCTVDVSGCRDAICGDGTISGSEDCEPTLPVLTSCQGEGFAPGGAGQVACGADCRFDTTACEESICGNGVVESGFEECDGSDFGADSCRARGFWGGDLACSGACTISEAACADSVCGNGTVEGSEVCDGFGSIATACSELAGFAGGRIGCSADCTALDTSGCIATDAGGGSGSGAGSGSGGGSGPLFNDADGDTIPDEVDNCPAVANLRQLDIDGDGLGNLCDAPQTYTVLSDIGTEPSSLIISLAAQSLLPIGPPPTPTEVVLTVASALATVAFDDTGRATLLNLSANLADTETEITIPALIPGPATPTAVSFSACILSSDSVQELTVADPLAAYRLGEWAFTAPLAWSLSCSISTPDGGAGITSDGPTNFSTRISVSRYDDSVTAECSTGGAIGTTDIPGAPLFPGFPGLPTTLDVSVVSFAMKARQL